MRLRIVVPVAALCAAGTVFGAGELANGQPTAGASASQDAGKLERRALFAVLTGRKEVDADGRRGAGDPDGRGSFTATIDGNELCFGITVKNLDAPGAAHIHKGRAHQNGGIVVPLVHPEQGDPGASAGCVSVAEELAQAILEHPRRYYANVHTMAFGGGAVRGQLFRRSR